MKKYIAEFIGTFTLAFVVGASLLGTFAVVTPVLAALVLGTFVYTIGVISGSHINPAVTIGLWSIKKIESKEALYYVVSQFLGAYFALNSLLILFPGKDISLLPTQSLEMLIAELFGMALFAFGIASVVYGKTPNHISGIVIGVSLLLGISISVLLGANGILNPAVALALNSFNLVYLFGPILGSVIGFNLYKYLQE